jgi:hypothetical protein
MKEQKAVPAEVVEKDHKLDGAATKTAEALAKHRWHWTLDETNPSRVSLGAYSRATGRNLATIRNHARGYELWIARGASTMTLTECLERARMSAEKTEIVEAVAEANAIGFKTATRAFAPDIKRVQHAIERKVEQQPAITPEETVEYGKKVARMIAAGRTADRQRAERKKNQKSMLLVTIEGELAQARRCLLRALDEARLSGGFDHGDELDYLRQSIDNLIATAGLLRVAVGGSANVDWDAELIKLGEVS